MAFEIEIQTVADVTEVARLIRERAAYWQESRVPAELRRAGAFGVDASVHDHTFRMWIESLHRRPPPSEAVLVGSFAARPGGGTIVRARVGVPPTSRLWYGVIGGLIALCLFTASWSAAVALALFLAMAATRDAVADRGITRRDGGAAHLAARLEMALQSSSDPDAIRAG